MQELISLSIGTLDFCGGLEVYGVSLKGYYYLKFRILLN